MSASEDQHVPVLRDEVLDRLDVRTDGTYVDGTFGRGGHSRAILERLGPAGKLLVIDRDPRAIVAAKELARRDERVTVIRGSFGDIEQIAVAQGVLGEVDGIVLDLGVSSPQLDDPERGFSFMRDGPLDMRMDTDAPYSAEEWLNSATEQEMAQVIGRYGEERSARRIARAIGDERKQQKICRTRQLAELIEGVLPRRGKGKHPATKTFQAIRIHINNELGELQSFLEAVLEVLSVGGRLCVISFHSLEDRLVKRFLRDHSRVDPALAKVPVVPPEAQPTMRLRGAALRAGEVEIERNARSRSAVLRSGERVR
ncbi:MAG: 16S rRNA (cytosine(1402)-N(4))-methyltransferase RsmH [Gammaproteobacteria bacterium]|jgi:16S rRNA (cytosine1402-N4)-methyltransferase|nr:16S rRNA (cytosine(1402)-N(4))-methyltransferase RsmH [Gammaproteobacteria bacterium]MDP6615590.1 16S rRNA (cytosine(1402)-N(4))-methyltransferase RsmH [Gammaproteobacteria bacterium]MDP6694736.1 16S rRNA (cytosine(1402)-N(4))-methyltransferase RsmH [Gammaproteobacteria bacterium]MDP7041387.1 16S rRNA (cytosine(1402)-N(4))-methyltransferase RsmH [Gammaproteobacteria bacterium]